MHYSGTTGGLGASIRGGGVSTNCRRLHQQHKFVRDKWPVMLWERWMPLRQIHRTAGYCSSQDRDVGERYRPPERVLVSCTDQTAAVLPGRKVANQYVDGHEHAPAPNPTPRSQQQPQRCELSDRQKAQGRLERLTYHKHGQVALIAIREVPWDVMDCVVHPGLDCPRVFPQVR